MEGKSQLSGGALVQGAYRCHMVNGKPVTPVSCVEGKGVSKYYIGGQYYIQYIYMGSDVVW